jgi:serine/threonine protein kinase
MNNNIQIYELIGKGKDGEIYRCEYNGKHYAVKKYKFVNYGFGKEFLRETSFLKNVKHNNIVNIVNVISDKSNAYIIMELMDSGLIVALKSVKNADEIDIMMHQLIEIITHIHNLGYIHGDLSMTNIMCADGNIKIIDGSRSTKIHRKKIVHGPTSYIAPPEIVKRDDIDPIKIDIWALGCIMYFIQTHNILFMGTDYNKQKEEIEKKIGSIDKKNTSKIDIDNIFTLTSHTIRPIKKENIKRMLPKNKIKGGVKISYMFNLNHSKRQELVKFNELEIMRRVNFNVAKHIPGDGICRIIEMLVDMNTVLSLPIESIFITLNNIFRLKDIYDSDVLNYDKIVVLHKMSIVVSTDYDITNENIFGFMDICSRDNSKIFDIETDLLNNLDWNIDPISCYDCVMEYKHVRPFFDIIMLFCHFSIDFLLVSTYYKLKIVKNLLKFVCGKIQCKNNILKYNRNQKKDLYNTIFTNVIIAINCILSSKYLYGFLMDMIKKYVRVINYEKYLTEIISSFDTMCVFKIKIDVKSL